ncbi:PPE domain-containing protein [Actinokineospora sp.]|uniref:PPE domain-containing protein n=1 Tax=Actinokineospora sp. TaxID=1872133 RepID=UPI003D6B370C
MAGDNGLGDLRFEGYSHQQLADELDKLRQGPGSESLHKAVRALKSIAEGLAETDQVLREELGKIGVTWEGSASEGGTEATKNAAIYASDATPAVEQSAGGVSEQGDAFSTTRNGAPDGGDLRGPTKLDGMDRFLGAFGHTTDNAKQVQQTNAAHEQAVTSMNGYSQGSQSALGSYQSLPVPPGMSLVATPYQGHGTTSAQTFNGNSSAYTPTGSPGAPGVPGQTGLPGGGGHGLTGIPDGPGGGGPGGTNNNQPGGGRLSTVGPLGPNIGGLPNPTNVPGGLRPGFPMGMLNDMSALAGLTGAGAGGAAAGENARKDRLVRGAGAFPDTPEGRAARAAARGAAPITDLPEEQSRAAKNAERIGARPGKAGASLMQPAAAGAKGEEDEEHVRKYGIDSEDVFGDERMVVSPVLGQDD